MQHTTSHELSQWAETDRILREDFNSDNAKIEAALSGKFGPFEIIKSMPLPSDIIFSLDLSDVDWSQWTAVGFFLDLLETGNQEIPRVYCQVETGISGGVQEYCSSENNGYLAMVTFMPFVLALLPLRDPMRQVRCVYLGGLSGTGIAACTYQDLNGLRIGSFNNRYFQHDKTLTLWGIR